MKCWRRSTFGVVVGILGAMLFTGWTIPVVCVALFHLIRTIYVIRDAEMTYIFVIFFSITAIFFGFLVVGIIKRRHKLMMPWMIFAGIGLIAQFVLILHALFGAVVSGNSFPIVFSILVVLAIGLFLWPIFSLFDDIRIYNLQGACRGIEYCEVIYKASDDN